MTLLLVIGGAMLVLLVVALVLGRAAAIADADAERYFRELADPGPAR